MVLYQEFLYWHVLEAEKVLLRCILTEKMVIAQIILYLIFA